MAESQPYTCWRCLLCATLTITNWTMWHSLSLPRRLRLSWLPSLITGGLFPTFTSDPLNRLLSQVRENFSFQYTNKKYPDEEVRGVKEYVAVGKYDPIYAYPPPYIYGSHMEALKKPNWLVEVFNKHLKSNDWPSYDKAVANNLTSPTDSEQKWTSIQAKC